MTLVISGSRKRLGEEKMIPRLIVMVGLPGSGKSTKALNIVDELNSQQDQIAVWLSSDDYRKRVLGNENDRENNNFIFKLLFQDMRKYLISGVSVVFDATNTTLKSRLRILNEVRDIQCYKIVYLQNTPYEECVERDLRREKYVGEQVIQKFISSFNIPVIEEGWDHIYCENLKKYDEREFLKYYERMLTYDQLNPHHIYTLGKHCDTLGSFYSPNTVENIAGRLHDIGKLFTQTIDERGVAHYYNHDCIGTYFLLSHPELVKRCDDLEFFNILFLVNYHMRAHRDFVGDKARKKYRGIFGDKKYFNLLEFAEFDKKASGTYSQHNGGNKE